MGGFSYSFFVYNSIRELMNNGCIYYHVHNDHPINGETCTNFSRFRGRFSTDIDMLCLKLSEEDSKVVRDVFNKAMNQMDKRVGTFVDQQMPLKSETVYSEYSDMIKRY